MNNYLAVCLDESVFLWNPAEQDGKLFLNTKTSMMKPTAVSWSQKNDSLLAIGFSNTQVTIRDFNHGKILREFEDHWARVSAIHWNPIHENVLSTASKDCEIINYDLRCQRPVRICKGHTQEVCGLKWNMDGSLLASGSNDNNLFIWDPRKTDKPVNEFSEHTAAVKA